MTIGGIKTVRTAEPYTARHMPWHLDCKNLDEGNQQYFKYCKLIQLMEARWESFGVKIREMS